MFYGTIDHDFLRDSRAMLALKREARLSKANLAKAVSLIGTPPDQVNNDLAIFVPESLQKFWTAETIKNKHIVASRMLPVVEVFSTHHKWVVVEEYGGRYATHFFDENGGMPGVNKSKSREDEAFLKLFGERRQTGRLAEVVGQVGGINPNGTPTVSRSGRARETANALRSEVIAYEHNFLWGDSDVDPLEFDGLVKQMRTKGIAGLNVHDLRGAPLTFARLLVDISRVRSKPYYASIEAIGLTEMQWASLAIEATDSARWARSGTEFKVSDGWSFNPVGMYLLTPSGDKIAFKIIPALAPEIALPSVAEGTPAVTLSYGSHVTSVTAGADASSKFIAGEDGVYKYAIKAVFALGSPVHFATPNISVAIGDIVTGVMNDSAVGTTDNPLRYYELWRTDKTGAIGTLKPLKRVEVKNESGHTEWVDDNAFIPGMETVIGVQISDHAMFVAQLLAPTRFPVPYAGFATDMIIARCDTPVVNHYRQQLIYLNCGSNEIGA